MNKKIKVIELYERLAKQENMPGKIKYCNDIYYLCIDSLENVFYYETNKGFQLMITINSVQALNREVEILEDEEEIDIEGIGELPIYESDKSFYDEYSIKANRYKINELVIAVKQLDKKINKEE